MIPCASITVVFVVTYKVMDAFLFESQCVDFTLPKSVDLTLLKYDDSKLLITTGYWNVLEGKESEY